LHKCGGFIFAPGGGRVLPEEGGLPMRLSSPSPCCVDIVRAAVAAAAAAVLADLIYMHV